MLIVQTGERAIVVVQCTYSVALKSWDSTPLKGEETYLTMQLVVHNPWHNPPD
jgi:hypothetical protein